MIDQKPMPMDYAPFHTMFEFDAGIIAYMERQYRNPYKEPQQRLAAQAWDSGLNYAIRVIRHARGQ
jgi:hypothetical protein